MLLPVLGIFRAGNASGMVLGLDDEYAAGGDDHMVDLRCLSVDSRKKQVVDYNIIFLSKSSQLFGDYLLTSLSAANCLSASPPYDNPYRQGCQQESAEECGDNGPVGEHI